MDRRIRWNVDGSKGLGSMVYLYLPTHPDSDPKTGLWEIMALPNPLYFPATPQMDEMKFDAGSRQWKYVRGYATFFKALLRFKNPLTGQPIFPKSKVEALNIGAYKKFNTKSILAEINELNKSEEAKWHEKNGHIFRKLEGSDKPRGWKPKIMVG